MSCIEVKLDHCNNLACSRGDHFICPNRVCYHVLHTIVLVDNKIQDESLYLVDVVRCMDTSCFSNEHIKCPSCWKSMHVKSIAHVMPSKQQF